MFKSSKSFSFLSFVLSGSLVLGCLQGCGTLNSPARKKAVLQKPELASENLPLSISFHQGVIQLADFHDSYEFHVEYPNSSEPTVRFGKKNEKLTFGSPVEVGSVKRLPQVRIHAVLWKNGEKTYECRSAILDPEVFSRPGYVAEMECVRLSGEGPLRIVLGGLSVQRSSEVGNVAAKVKLMPAKSLDILMEKATNVALILKNTGTFQEENVAFELGFVSDEKGHARGDLIFTASPLSGNGTLLNVSARSVSHEAFRSLLAGDSKGLLLKGRVRAQVSKGESIKQEFVDAKVLIEVEGTEGIRHGNAHEFRVQLKGTVVELDGRKATPENGTLAFAGELVCSEKPAGRFSVMSYNVENFWDDIEGNTEHNYDDFQSEKGSNWYASGFSAIKARKIAQVLAMAGTPEVVSLQEIESARNSTRTLEILKPELQKLGYTSFALGAQEENNPTAVTTLVVSKFPILKNESLAFRTDGEDVASARDPQVVTLDVQGTPLRVYNNHWKSKSGEKSTPVKNPDGTLAEPQTSGEIMRMEVAKLIKADIDAALSVNPEAEILVMGDFNSEYNESMLMGKRSGSVQGLNATGDERMMVANLTSNRLYNLWFELPELARCTYSFDGLRNCLDNFLLSDSLYDNSGLQYVDNSYRVMGWNGTAAARMLNADGSPMRWQVLKETKKVNGNKVTILSKHSGVGYSDHLPIIADFVAVPKTPFTQRNKMILHNPSTTEFGPASRPIEVDSDFACKPEDPVFDLTQTDFSLAENFFACFQANGLPLPLKKVGDFDKAVEIGGKTLIVTMTKAYGENKDYLRKIVQKSDALYSIRGRVGFSGGELAIFADKAQSICTNLSTQVPGCNIPASPVIEP
jgi:endonuclease/exonuclease/phosphatase family metal-dependent hydrolase